MEENMKRILLVIGNGFDLQCGLKTTYKDFFFDRYGIIDKAGEYHQNIGRVLGADKDWDIEEAKKDFIQVFENIVKKKEIRIEREKQMVG